MWRTLICLFALTVVLHVRPGGSKRTTEAEAIAAMERELDRATAADEFSGTVVIAKHGKPIFAQSYNRADREAGTLNTLHTSFNIGSINKTITAITVVRLVQDGKLALTDTVGKWIPDYPNRAIADQVTIHHLLTHTGGTGDIFDENYEDYRLKLQTHDDYVAYFGNREPLFAPGARWEYSNYGFVLLGAIIERATGTSYYDAVVERVYVPAGMTLTNHPLHDERVGAIGYTRYPSGALQPNHFILPYRGTSAGGGWSTSRDLLALMTALGSHRLLDEAHTKLLTTGKVRTRHGFKYAYGIADMTIDGVRCIGHNGGFPGANASLLACANGYTISIVANFDPPAASRIEQLIVLRLPK